MYRVWLGLLSGMIALAACVAAPSGAPLSRAEPDPAYCVALYRHYDFLEATLSTPSGRRDRWIAPPALMRQGQRIRQSGCLTMTRDLIGLEDIDGASVDPGGQPLDRVSVHAGVVTNMTDDARAIGFFERQGYRARSVGSAPLGRRVFVGPLRDEAEMLAVLDLARSAGFISPYPRRF